MKAVSKAFEQVAKENFLFLLKFWYCNSIKFSFQAIVIMFYWKYFFFQQVVVEPEEEKSKGVSIVDLQSSYLIFMWLFLVLKKKMWKKFCFFQVGMVVEEVKGVATEVDGEEGLKGEKSREEIF